jgi:hypothetical protein
MSFGGSRRSEDKTRTGAMVLRGQPWHLWRAATAGFTLAAISLLGAACGGGASPGVASVGSSPSTTAASGGASVTAVSQTQLQAGVAFAACVRKHGLPTFPDPPYQGGELNKLGFTKQALEKYTSSVCRKEALVAGMVESHAEIEQYIEMYLRMATCMRARGIANFPDPTGQGQLDVSEPVENEAAYPAAAKACGAPPRAPASFWQRAGAP